MDPFSQPHYYLIELQYLGFRYHGWAKQPNLKTVQGMVNKTLRFVLGDIPFKTLGSSRTDAMVSANATVFELFLQAPLDSPNFLETFNKNLPQDIRALSITETDANFNIIQSVKLKEYLYLFTFGQKIHPFTAPFMTSIQNELNLELMKEGAKLFEGEHNFEQYCYKPKPGNNYVRTILTSEIIENDVLLANFFPDRSYLLRIKGEGFMHHQIRLMMGALILLGRGSVSLDDIDKSLQGSKMFEQNVAHASGLVLNKLDWSNTKENGQN